MATPEEPKNESTGKEAAYALAILVGTRVRITVRVCSDADVSLDGRRLGGDDDAPGSPGRHEHRTRPGTAGGLLRPAPRLLSPPRPGPRTRQGSTGQAHPRVACAGVPRPPRHPSRRRQAGVGWRRHQDRQGGAQDARREEAASNVRVEHQAGIHLRPLLPGRCRSDACLVGRSLLGSQRIRLTPGLSHPRRRGVYQPRQANAAGQDDPAARFAAIPAGIGGHRRTVLLRGRRLLRHRQDRARTAGQGKPPGDPREEQRRGLSSGPTAGWATTQGAPQEIRKETESCVVAGGLSRVRRTMQTDCRKRPAPSTARPV